MVEIIEALRSKKQAAKYLQISESSVDRHRRSGALPFIQVGNLVRFRQEDLESFVNSRRCLTQNGGGPAAA